MPKFILVILLVIILSTEEKLSQNITQISILHINDFHARFEETSLDSGKCKNRINCIGGFSRLYALIQKKIQENLNLILLNAGDNFEGTLWYDIYKWNVTQHFFNKLPIDAYTLGNHEFEDGIDGLVPFLENVKSPVVVANIDAENEPAIKSYLKKSLILEKNNLKIGIIGVTTTDIKNFNNVGNLIFLNKSASVNSEAIKLFSLGTSFNIVLSHCGYEVDLDIARKSTGISLIVGGHSHTFLYNGQNNIRPVGPYPSVVKNLKNETVLVVQAGAYNKYLGSLMVFFENGQLKRWNGNPIYLDTSLPQDEKINEELQKWQDKINSYPNQIIGKSLVRLEQISCDFAECLIGNFLTDAMVEGYLGDEAGSWTRASIAVIHAGGIRAGIDAGDISYNEILSVQPFKNTIDLITMRGEHFKQILEFCVATSKLNLLQVSGIKVIYNLSQPVGSRIISLELRCQKCPVPIYEDLNPETVYRILIPDFLAKGGFGFDLIQKYLITHETGSLDRDLYIRYVESKSPILQEIQGRIKIY